MIATRLNRTSLSVGLAGALAVGAALTGTVSVTAAPKADATLAKAQAALKAGKTDQAIDLIEAAVRANPQEPSYRALLGSAYLRAGRFESAVQALDDAMTLGDNGAKTALALALANVAAGHGRDAVAILNDWREAIPADDLGLALALAGDTERGVTVISDAVRGGDATVKARQNLAYALALDGRWRDARTAMAQDVPADQMSDRIGEWAAQARPEDYRLRVAKLLGVPLRADGGQPAGLALASVPGAQQAAAEAAPQLRPAVAAAAPSELPPLDGPAPVQVAAAAPQPAPAIVEAVRSEPVAAPAPTKFAAAFAPAPQPAPVAASGLTYVSNPIIQPIAALLARVFAPTPVARPRAVRPAPRPAQAVAVRANGTHLVQLGSFASAQGARRAWGIYTAKTPALRGYRMTITQAQVRGKSYWRVAAAGFDAGGASGACSRIKAKGGMCFAYAAKTVASPVRQAARTVAGKPKLAVR